MRSLPCDQIALDMLETKRRFPNISAKWKLSPTMVMQMVAEVDRLRVSATDGITFIPQILAMFEPFEPGQEEYYEELLKVVLKRRYEFRERVRKNAKHGRYVPFAPR